MFQDSRSLSRCMHGKSPLCEEILNANDKDAEIAKRGRGINPRRNVGVSFGRHSQCIVARLISDEFPHASHVAQSNLHRIDNYE